VAGLGRGASNFTDLKELLVAYAKQETVDPVRSLGRYLGFGLAGSVFVAVGGLFLSLAVLRVLQEETGDVFAGRLSFLPYLFTLLAVVVCLAASGLGIKKVKDAQARRPGAEGAGRMA
jgi:hypothetical protein